MAETNIAGTQVSDMTNQIDDFGVASETTEGALDQKETTWQMTEWNEWLGYYKTIPELQIAVDAKANWTMGAGFTSDPSTTLLLSVIKGHGKDSFNTILSNMVRTYTIAGDSFAEIIRDDNENVVNLKPLSPDTIKIVANRAGRIIRYEQTSRTKKPNRKITPEKMLHLSRKRIADELHGISIIPAVKWIIDARNEAMADWRKVLHRNVAPLWIFHLDTDDETQITTFKNKWDTARKDGENMFIPKGNVEPELVSTATNASLNPITWIEKLGDLFFQTVNVPQIIVGNAKEFTDASGKIVYLAYEQSVKGEQLYVEEQILGQLNLEIQLTFPATLQNELISDQEKAPDLQASQPNDTTEELEGNT